MRDWGRTRDRRLVPRSRSSGNDLVHAGHPNRWIRSPCPPRSSGPQPDFRIEGHAVKTDYGSGRNGLEICPKILYADPKQGNLSPLLWESAVKATVTGKGRVTIPKKVREALGLGPGDEPEFVVECDRAAIYPRRRYRVTASSARCGEAGRPLRAVRRRRPTSCGACTAVPGRRCGTTWASCSVCGPWTSGAGTGSYGLPGCGLRRRLSGPLGRRAGRRGGVL